MHSSENRRPRTRRSPSLSEQRDSVVASSMSLPKRQKTDATANREEVKAIIEARLRTFSHHPAPKCFIQQLIKAGFFYSNRDDRVVCIYCHLICQHWDLLIDDPSEVHRTQSPQCFFLTNYLNPSTETKDDPPVQRDYLTLHQRRATFEHSLIGESQRLDQLADAGFYLQADRVHCFSCRGSLPSNSLQYRPLVEHVRNFPQCRYAQQLCGKKFYNQIRRAGEERQLCENSAFLRRLEPPQPLAESTRENLFEKNVEAGLDLPTSMAIQEKHGFERAFMRRVWEIQFRTKHEYFETSSDLLVACWIEQIQSDPIHGAERKLVSLHPGWSPAIVAAANQSLSYADLSTSTEIEVATHHVSQRELAAQFQETKVMAIARETSLDENHQPMHPSNREMFKGGWAIPDKGLLAECPHCHVQYRQWEPRDNPLDIHRLLSPHCLFVLSPDPLCPSTIPIRTGEEQFPNDVISTAHRRPYNGLAEPIDSPHSELANRLKSFNDYPGGAPPQTDELVQDGFHYRKFIRYVECFYCGCQKRIPPSGQELQTPPHIVNCFYDRQKKDFDPTRSPGQNSPQCSWCLKEEKQVMALPCRHRNVCARCAPSKRRCGECPTRVDHYFRVYL